jgi:hypothetical protein
VQVGVQVPPTHDEVAPLTVVEQVWPHVPQLVLSVCVFTHVELQTM